MCNQKGVKIIEQIFKTYIWNQKSFQRVAEKCKPIDGGNGRCVVELTIEEEHENPAGTLHGGLSATLADIISTAALIASGRKPGVSVDLNMTYLKAVNRGETIIVDANILKQGKTLAFAQIDFRKKDDNSLVATGRHTKAFPS